MFVVREKIHAPNIQATTWINSPPLSIKDLRGKVILVDFWDYTCINCIRTLPYLKEWNQRYNRHGLVIIGVHAPEFWFAKDPNTLDKAVQDFDLTYPIALDNHYQTWNAFANRYWPAKYLIDKEGYIRYFYFGEGGYAETEEVIQALLHEITPDRKFLPVMEAVRESDNPGTVCFRPTPELYLGFNRGHLGNREGYRLGQVINYASPQQFAPEIVYLEGAWKNEAEYIETTGEGGHAIHLVYRGAEMNLVMRPEGSQPITITVTQDDAPLPELCRGEDILMEESGQTVVRVAEPRMYRLTRNQQNDIARRLTLDINVPGLQAYAFTFVSCLKL